MITAEAAELIVKRCPGWVVNSIELLGEGDFCTAYLVNKQWVFRFARHERAAASLMREACLLPLITDRFDLRIPSPQLVNADYAPAFMCYPVLPGPALTRERYLQLKESDRERCAGQVARFLAQMHAVDMALACRCGVEITDYVAQSNRLLAKARTHLFVKLSEPERAFVERAIAGYLESHALSDFKPVLLHGDLSPDHVLYDKTAATVTGIIDFGDMVIGDPASDLVLIYEDYGLDFFCRFLRAYVTGDVSSLLERVYRLYVVGAIEWAVEKAEQSSAELEAAIAQLCRLKASGEQQLRELLSVCSVA